MYFCDEGIVLARRLFRDNDKIATIFTRKNGKLDIVFKSITKPKSKLRIFSEVFTYSDYRFYLAKNSNFPVCTGGKIISTFNNIRNNQEKLIASFYLTELINLLTPMQQSSENKFELLLNAFKYLENTYNISKFFLISYALILIEYCGIGFKDTNLGIDTDIWNKLHDPSFSYIDIIESEMSISYFSSIINKVYGKIREHTSREINTLKFVKI